MHNVVKSPKIILKSCGVHTKLCMKELITGFHNDLLAETTPGKYAILD